MICNCCRHEFVVEMDNLGRKLKCPNCSSLVLISNKEIICRCSACKHKLAVEMWMLGTTAPCPVCGRDVKLTLGSAESRKLFAGKDIAIPRNSKMKKGDIIGKYKIESCLGIGGMGEVYLATHTLLGTNCALKLLRNDEIIQEEDKQRLLREARLASSIHHQNLIAVLDAEVDRQTDLIYIVMEYVDGVSIDQVLANGPMQEERVLQIIRAVAEALCAAGELQIVHRDIKPGNIMLSCDGKIKLADLGIAKIDSSKEHTLTVENAILGTPAYASPEQLRASHKVDARADIYSLGATMYHMLSGEMPFDGDSIFNIMAQVLEKNPQPLQSKVAVSPQTARLVHSMMSKDPAERPANMKDLIRQIDHVLLHRDEQMLDQDVYQLKKRNHNKLPIRPAPTDAPQRSHAGKKQHMRFWLTFLFFLLGLVLAGLYWGAKLPFAEAFLRSPEFFASGIPAPAISGKVPAKYVRNTAEFSLEGRIQYLQKNPPPEKSGSYMLQQHQSLLLRLQNELELRQQQNNQSLRQRAGTLIATGGSLADTMANLSQPPAEDSAARENAAFYQSLKQYIQCCHKDKNYRTTPEAIQHCNQLQASLAKQDPLLLLQALQWFCKETGKDKISGDILRQVLVDLNPDFSYSKLPPEALELPTAVVTELLKFRWDEVDGATYGKSNLIIELSRPANSLRYLVVTALCNAGCRINIPDTRGLYPIHWAMLSKKIFYVDALLARSADLQVHHQGMTLLQWGIKQKIPVEILEKLLFFGAELPDIPLENVAPVYRRLWQKTPTGTHVKLITSHETIPQKLPAAGSAAENPHQKLPDTGQPAPEDTGSPVEIANAHLGRPRSYAVTQYHDLTMFSLPGRYTATQQKLVILQKRAKATPENVYFRYTLELQKKLFLRLQLELQNQNTDQTAGIRHNTGTLLNNAESILAAAGQLSGRNQEGTAYFQSLKTFAQKSSSDPQFSKSQEAADIRNLWRQYYKTQDPMIFILALLMLNQEKDNGISAEMQKELVAAAAPDFRYSKFPPEAMDLPGEVIVALLKKPWDEVDGITYGKSNLLLELSRSGRTARPEVLKALLAAGCNVNLADTRGYYPIHWAMQDYCILHELLKFAPDLHAMLNGKNVVDWGIDQKVPVSSLKLLSIAGAPAPDTPQQDMPPQYREFFHVKPKLQTIRHTPW